jgi:hypothetical protein
VTSVPELVALLYRADWKQLSLSARVTWQRDRTVDQQLRLRTDTKLEQRARAAGKFLRLPDVDQPRTGQLHPQCHVCSLRAGATGSRQVPTLP